MARRIVVTSDCQTAGICGALSLFLPDDTVVPAPISSTPAGQAALERTVADGDIWITTHPIEQIARSIGTMIEIPRIRFGFFHPDIGYMTDTAGKNIPCVECDYHSMIVAACWFLGYAPEVASMAFTEANFDRLGYFGAWPNESRAMRRSFEKCSLDFGSFLSIANRQNPFMFTQNHPKQIALTELAQQVAVRLGAPRARHAPEFSDALSESLDAIIWPVYPEIGRRYGVRGHYRWRLRSRIVDGLQTYISESFAKYEQLRLTIAQLSGPSQARMLQVQAIIRIGSH